MSASQEVTFLLARRPLRDCNPERMKDPDSFIPRIARLMALAIRLEELVRDETFQNYAELAQLGRITRARMTQIMKLLQLAPALGVQGLISGVAGSAAATLAFQIWAQLDGQEYPCRLQADFVGNERILGRDGLNRLEILFRGPIGEVIVNP